MIKNGFHLTYCTNIHPGESWKDTFDNLQFHIPKIKQEVSPSGPLGIGLRLSNEASLELIKEEKLRQFKSWLQANETYVFTFNGFPFGGFHGQVVKDKVHHPDWTTTERKDYTLRLFEILKELLPEGMDGGISTSPLSYKFWHDSEEKLKQAQRVSTLHIVDVALKLYQISKENGKVLHLDIEPEPDGLMENTQDVLEFYENWLIPLGKEVFGHELGLSEQESEIALKEHVRLCYDVCHFAVVYEKPEQVFEAFTAKGIKIGKIQISAALKVELPEGEQEREAVGRSLLPFAESTYLHQVVARNKEGGLQDFKDLPLALETIKSSSAKEWRIHFHVPVFLAEYGKLASTQKDIREVLEYIKRKKITNHLEVETYTWGVLPEEVDLNLTQSIIRELQWVKENMQE